MVNTIHATLSRKGFLLDVGSCKYAKEYHIRARNHTPPRIPATIAEPKTVATQSRGMYNTVFSTVFIWTLLAIFTASSFVFLYAGVLVFIRVSPTFTARYIIRSELHTVTSIDKVYGSIKKLL